LGKKLIDIYLFIYAIYTGSNQKLRYSYTHIYKISVIKWVL